jgi:hypothetical protein
MFVVQQKGAKTFAFKHSLQIIYTKELEETPYLQKISLFQAPAKAGKQESIISLNDVEALMIYEDGNFSPPFGLLIEKYWSYEKLDKLLPLDFQSDDDNP